jgi:alpha-tubulin suppressor-like RCC1 family protein
MAGDCVIPEQIVSDGDFVMVQMSDGTVRGWGRNFNGQLGVGNNRNAPRPTLVSTRTGLAGVTDIGASGTHACAVDASGVVWCWGNNSVGQLGVPASTAVRLEPVDSGFDRVIEVEAGGAHTCAIRNDATVWCWGQGSGGALGDGRRVGAQPSPVQAVGLSDVVDLGLGSAHSCAVTQGGEVFCWGQNTSRQVSGQPDSFVFTPVEVEGLSSDDPVLEVSAGGSHTCALHASGTIDCWGRNDSGQIGDGTGIRALRPTVVAGLPSSIVEVEATFSTSCARSSSGFMACWGQGVFGQLGDGSNSNSNNPVPVEW